jgi:hypothetical protein
MSTRGMRRLIGLVILIGIIITVSAVVIEYC